MYEYLVLRRLLQAPGWNLGKEGMLDLGDRSNAMRNLYSLKTVPRLVPALALAACRVDAAAGPVSSNPWALLNALCPPPNPFPQQGQPLLDLRLDVSLFAPQQKGDKPQGEQTSRCRRRRRHPFYPHLLFPLLDPSPSPLLRLSVLPRLFPGRSGFSYPRPLGWWLKPLPFACRSPWTLRRVSPSPPAVLATPPPSYLHRRRDTHLASPGIFENCGPSRKSQRKWTYSCRVREPFLHPSPPFSSSQVWRLV